ncbi:hypothetical protein B7O87_00745 [Cylindrospermopsis raciborskii CENA303]|uniref:Uncharacterized protein n=1 Tax=Cylindrospermopsis raciborskii CENA303 TaxID=1170769 RepID=A0A1X4GJU0_9CYAN|nr:hypothetical protein B7O87_00745 [Cylindrospermopsis raciborskii CENA303]
MLIIFIFSVSSYLGLSGYFYSKCTEVNGKVIIKQKAKLIQVTGEFLVNKLFKYRTTYVKGTINYI